MVIRVNHKKVIAKAIEWADRERKNPIAFLFKCPYCRRDQWAHKKQLYIAYNGTKNHRRCKYCNIGLAKRGESREATRSKAPYKGFTPKSPGWSSIHYDHPYDQGPS